MRGSLGPGRTDGTRRAVFAVAALVAGCSVGDGGAARPRDGDAALFATAVQPVVARDCSYLGCHGREGMPLVLYAVDYLRLRDPEGEIDPSTPELDERVLSDVEIQHDRRALASRVEPDDPRGDAIVRRLLPLDRGGVRHAGVVVYENPDDPAVRTLREFLATARDL